jgi:hypothetical protein
MTTVTFNHWLAATTFSQFIQRTRGAIALIQILHIICLATLFALALSLALRLSGRGLASEPLASLARRFVPAIWICLSLLLLTGSLLIVAEPYRTLNNLVFYVKMVLVILASLLTLRIAALARSRAEIVSLPRTTVATLYMLIWCGIIIAGRLIAYR